MLGPTKLELLLNLFCNIVFQGTSSYFKVLQGTSRCFNVLQGISRYFKVVDHHHNQPYIISIKEEVQREGLKCCG